jgi:hypothetical protein
MAVVTCSGERPVGKKGNLQPIRPIVDTSAIFIRNFSFLWTAQIFGVCLGMRTLSATTKFPDGTVSEF